MFLEPVIALTNDACWCGACIIGIRFRRVTVGTPKGRAVPARRREVYSRGRGCVITLFCDFVRTQIGFPVQHVFPRRFRGNIYGSRTLGVEQRVDLPGIVIAIENGTPQNFMPLLSLKAIPVRVILLELLVVHEEKSVLLEVGRKCLPRSLPRRYTIDLGYDLTKFVESSFHVQGRLLPL